MNPNIQQILDKLPFLKSPRLAQSARFLKRAFFSFGIFLLLFFAGIVGWFHLHPLASYENQIRSQAKIILQADEFRFKKIGWYFKPLRLGMGFQFEDMVIEGSAVAARLRAPNLIVEIEPFKLLLGKIPMRVTSGEGEWALPSKTFSASGDQPKTFLSPDRLWKNLRLRLDFKHFSITTDASHFGFTDGASIMRAAEVDLQWNFVGFPGYFDCEVSSNLDVSLEGSSLSAKGPLNMSFEGHSQIVQGEVVGVNFSQVDMDLSEVAIAWEKRYVEKPAGMLLKFRGEGQAVLGDHFDWKVFELKQGSLLADELRLGFSASYNTVSKMISLRWIHTPQEVSRLRLPIRGLSEIPLRGMVEVQGNFKSDARNLPEAGWKLSFNNLKIPSAEVKGMFDPASSGTLSVSFVSEGAISKGLLQTPRTELQIDAAAAQLKMANGQLMKPQGDPFNVLMKATVQNDELTVSNLDLNLNNLNLRGRMKLTNVSKYLFDKQAAFMNISVESNSVNLSRWSAYLPLFRRIPLEGLVQFAGAADGPLYSDGDALRDVSWRVDRISASKIKGAFDRASFVQMGYSPDDFSMSGPFNAEFYFQGRGKGSIVNQGTLIAQADFSKVFFDSRSFIRKTADIPLQLDVGIEQTTNRFSIRRGSLKFHQMALNVEGNILNGSKRNWVDIKLDKDVHLEDWRSFFPELRPEMPLRGDVALTARLGFEKQGVFEGALDWRKLSLDGILDFKNISIKLGKFKNPLMNGKGKLVITGNSLTLPGFDFQIGPTKAKFSFNGRTLSTKSAATVHKLAMAQGNLGWIFGKSPWDLSMVLTADNFDSAVFVQEANKKGAQFSEEKVERDVEALITTFLNNPKLSKSRLKLVYAARESKKSPLAKNGAQLVLNWEKGVLRAEPMVLGAFGGKISGAFSFDGNPYLSRKDPPLSSFSGSFSSIRAEELLDFLGSREQIPVRAELDGRVQLTFEGMGSEEMWSSAKGRVTGKARDAEYSGLGELKNLFQKFFQDSEARDYLMGKGRLDKCFDPKFSSDFDLSFNQGVIKLGEIFLVYPNASKIRLSGDLTTDFKARFSGDLIAGPDCVKTEARRCLEHGQDFVAFPFAFTGDLKNPFLTSPVEDQVPDFVECMKKTTSARLNAASVDSALRKKDQESQVKLKKILKGSSQ